MSQIDFLTPLRDLRRGNASIALELLDSDESDDDVDGGGGNSDNVVINPHESGVRRYGNDAWLEYKAGLSSRGGYVMIEYGWFYVDGISFAVEICVDHLVHRALSTYVADLVTGSRTLVPSFSSDDDGGGGSVTYAGIPKEQAMVQLVSSGGMGVNVDSIAVADGGHVFLQDGIFGDLPPRRTYGQDPCNRNQYEFEGGSECVRRTAVVSGEYATTTNDDERRKGRRRPLPPPARMSSSAPIIFRRPFFHSDAPPGGGVFFSLAKQRPTSLSSTR